MRRRDSDARAMENRLLLPRSLDLRGCVSTSQPKMTSPRPGKVKPPPVSGLTPKVEVSHGRKKANELVVPPPPATSSKLKGWLTTKN